MKPLSPSLPHIIAMVGAPGSGKTQFAVEFAKIFNSPVVSSRQFEVFTDNTKTISDATLSLLEEFLFESEFVICGMKICQDLLKHSFCSSIWISY